MTEIVLLDFEKSHGANRAHREALATFLHCLLLLVCVALTECALPIGSHRANLFEFVLLQQILAIAHDSFAARSHHERVAFHSLQLARDHAAWWLQCRVLPTVLAQLCRFDW